MHPYCDLGLYLRTIKKCENAFWTILTPRSPTEMPETNLTAMKTTSLGGDKFGVIG